MFLTMQMNAYTYCQECIIDVLFVVYIQYVMHETSSIIQLIEILFCTFSWHKFPFLLQGLLFLS